MKKNESDATGPVSLYKAMPHVSDPRALHGDEEGEPEPEGRSRALGAVTCGAILIVAGFGIALLFRPDPDPCPTATVRLNPWEYELQRRRCQAIAHGALERRYRAKTH